MAENLAHILGIELLDRLPGLRLPRAPAVERRHRARARAPAQRTWPHLDDDRHLAPDIAKAADLVRSGAIVAAAAMPLPELW